MSSCHRDPKELHKNIDATGSVDQLDYLEQVHNTCDTDAAAADAAAMLLLMLTVV